VSLVGVGFQQVSPTVSAAARSSFRPTSSKMSRRTSMSPTSSSSTTKAARLRTLARALDWDLDRVETAVRHLDIRLAVGGLRLRAEGATIRIEGHPGCSNSTLGRYSTAALETVMSTRTSAKRYGSQHSAKTFVTHPKKGWSKPSDGIWSKPEADGHADQNPSSSASCSPTAVTDTGPAFPLTRLLRSTDRTPAFPLTKSLRCTVDGWRVPSARRALHFT
jgi:hypothetical protein